MRLIARLGAEIEMTDELMNCLRQNVLSNFMEQTPGLAGGDHHTHAVCMHIL